MPPLGVVLAAVLTVILAGCESPERSFGLLTAPSPVASTPTPPAPNPPGGPSEDTPIPGSGPDYRVGTITVASGQTVDSRIEPTDPACWPNWDASGRCKAFEITAPFDGTLMVAVRMTTPAALDTLDLFLIDPGRAYVISSDGINAEEASLPVTAGSIYGVAVMTYATTPVPFQLQVEVVR
jgi:hypothetical protein